MSHWSTCSDIWVPELWHGLATYRDGSKMDEGTGDGVYCPNLIIKHLYDNCSLSQAEILAIKKKAEMVREISNSITGPETIYVDSQAALKAISSSAIKSRATLSCKKDSLSFFVR